MKLLVCGGRHFDNYTFLSLFLDNIIETYYNFTPIEIVSGGCSGADALGEQYAAEHNLDIKIFKAEWNKYGRAAGPIRDKEMINYIAQYPNSHVVAFCNERTKGTNYTIKEAYKHNIDVCYATYEITECNYELYEGISKPENEFVANFNSDNSSDIIKFKNQFIHSTRHAGKMYFYGYKIDKDSNKEIYKEFLRWVKNDGVNSMLVDELIDKSIEDFYVNCPIKHFDAIFCLKSSSNLVYKIAETIDSKFDNTKIIKLDKKPTSKLDIDWDKFNLLNINFEYKQKFKRFLLTYINSLKKDEYFSISKVSPKYRKLLTSMTLIDDTINMADLKNILVIDDTLTTGFSIDDAIHSINDCRYEGNIVIFSLFRN